MPANTNDGIKLPVSLQVEAGEFQSILNGLQASVNKLEPKGKIFDKTTKEVANLQKQMDQITASMRQGFQNPAQLDRFVTFLEKFGRDLQTTITGLSRVGFDDIDLQLVDPNDLKNLQRLQIEADDLKKKVNNFSTDKMREVINGTKDLKKTFDEELKLNISTATFDKAMNKATERLEELKDAAQESGDILKNAQNNLNKVKAIKDASKHAQGIFSLRKNGKGEYSDYLKDYFKISDKGDITGWKNRKLLADQMKEWGVTNAEAFDKLNNISFGKGFDIEEIKKKLKEVFELIKSEVDLSSEDVKKKLNDAIETAKQGVRDATTQNNNVTGELENTKELVTTLKEVGEAKKESSKYHGDYTDLQQQAQQAVDNLEDYKQAIVQAVLSSESYEDILQQVGDVLNRMRAPLQGVAQDARDSAAAMKEADASQQRLTAAIKRWFSFREVINLTKRAIKDAVTHIKELDATMTQIAVVTNMTQADLWKQIGTYSAIAQQYGVTTNGVYRLPCFSRFL